MTIGETLLLSPGVWGRPGGIEAYQRLLIRSLGELDNGSRPINGVIRNDRPQDLPAEFSHFRACSGSRIRFASTALSQVRRLKPERVLIGHINFARLAPWVRRISPSSEIWFFLYGVEAWRTLTPLARRALVDARHLISISNYTRQELCHRNGIPEERVELLPCALDPAWSARLAEPKFSRKRAPIILTVGRMAAERYKGVDTVLQALPEIARTVHAVKYVVVGDGEDRPRLEGLARGLGVADRVEFRGRISDQDLARVYAEAAVFAMPSPGEGFGIVYLEAGAYGVPSIAAIDCGAADAVVDGETGYLVPPADPGALARAAVKLLLDDALAAAMGQKAREFAMGPASYSTFRDRVRGFMLANEVDSVELPVGAGIGR